MQTLYMSEFLTRKKKLDAEVSAIAKEADKLRDHLASLESEYTSKNIIHRTLERRKQHRLHSRLSDKIRELTKNSRFLEKEGIDLFLICLRGCGYKSDEVDSGPGDSDSVSKAFMILKGLLSVGTDVMKSLYECLNYRSDISDLNYYQNIGNFKISINEFKVVLNKYHEELLKFSDRKDNDLVFNENKMFNFSDLEEFILILNNSNIDQFTKNELGKSQRQLNNYLSEVEDSINYLKETILYNKTAKIDQILAYYEELKQEAERRDIRIPPLKNQDIGFILLGAQKI